MNFLKTSIDMIKREPVIFLFFLVTSLLLALTEGLSISLLIPVLDAGGEGSINVPLIGPLLDPVMALPGRERFVLISIFLASVLLLRGGLQFSSQFLGALLPLRFQCIVMRRVHALLLHGQLNYIHSKKHGEFKTLIQEHPVRVATALRSCAEIIGNIALIGVYLVIMIAISPPMTLAAVGFAGFMMLLLRKLSASRLRVAGARLSDSLSRLHNSFFEMIQGIKLVRLSNAEKLISRRFNESVDGYYHVDFKRNFIGKIQNPLFMTAAGLFICALLATGAMLHEENDTSWVLMLLLFIICLYRMLGPVGAIINAQASIFGNMDAFVRLDNFYKEVASAQQSNGTQVAQKLTGQVVFDNVSYAYPNSEEPALHNLSFTFAAGQMVALVGPSGSGKSTIVGLMARLYDPQEGKIVIDNTDLQDLEIGSWRQRVGVVTQETFLFNDTVGNNIAFGRDKVPFEKIQEAGRMAAADDFINQLPEGYDTFVGDRGVRLSGGQVQRLTMARALLSDPDLLILDEATSSLDSITEKMIQSTITAMRGQKTFLIVAHRLSTIHQADVILVVNNGQIVEQGSHQELIKSDSVYKKLYQSQQLDIVMDEADENLEIHS